MRLGATDPTTGEYVDTRPWYIRARDWLADSAVVNAATSARDWTVSEAQQAIQDLYNTGVQFQQTMSDLLSVQDQANQDADLQSQYNDLVSRGANIQSVISNAVAGVQNVVQWIKDNVGVDISGSTAPPAGLQGLGFVQVIPLAIIGAVVAATALAGAWIVDARSAITKIQALQALADTVPPDQRASVINNALKQSGGLSSTISSATVFLAVAAVIAAGVFFAPELKKLARGKS